MGRDGDYFANRWSDLTYVAGLALLQQGEPGRVLELALRGVRHLVGIDVVFSKLRLARRGVCPSARNRQLAATKPDGALLPGEAFGEAGVEPSCRFRGAPHLL